MNKIFFSQNTLSDESLPIEFSLNASGDIIRGSSGNDMSSTINYSIIGYSESGGVDSTLFVGTKNVLTSSSDEVVDTYKYSVSKGISDIYKLEFSIFIIPNNPNDPDIYDPTMSPFKVSTTGSIITTAYYKTGVMPQYHSRITFDDSNPDYLELYYSGSTVFLDGTVNINLKELTNLDIKLSIDILAN